MDHKLDLDFHREIQFAIDCFLLGCEKAFIAFGYKYYEMSDDKTIRFILRWSSNDFMESWENFLGVKEY